MKKSTKAALLSGLIFPGIGHLILKYHLRGSALLIASMVALWILVNGVYQSAHSIVDRVNSGDIPLDTNAILAAAADSGSSDGSLLPTIASVALLAFWLFGIFDSYRLGAEIEHH